MTQKEEIAELRRQVRELTAAVLKLADREAYPYPWAPTYAPSVPPAYPWAPNATCGSFGDSVSTDIYR